jgi:hypothetical protein
VARQRNDVVLDNTMTTVDGLTIAGIGDPEFTPDKSETPAADPSTSPLLQSGALLATTIQAAPAKVDVAMVHDPAMATPLNGVVPLILAGHLHKRQVSIMPEPAPAPAASGASGTPAPTPSEAAPPGPTRLMVEGSTGGAGLRGLQKEDPTPLSLSVLYFDEKHELKAYDDIQLGGTGQSNVEMQRNVVGAKPETIVSPSATQGGG